MSDTIEWLETIGKNASLRHAPAEELAQVLTDASDTLKAAVINGDSSLLSAELGDKRMRVDHDTHSPGHDEEEEPDHDGGKDDLIHPDKLDQGKPSHGR
ncbi:hypothetical protein [Dyella caseinilytica]|uniref:Uncharacterized protein n=1 Tax=Dyella caseinilytica TaxID=1849581 RepID=A0ABX7GY16_9GAMM|nr:hypothetical protein [Dyella caseinilytica]QRN54843.1 hypothetical protein ISN74_05675 [Dyella caseinilytica]GFZ97313.1 hypothetical protein GCM10011408_17230 [Dyella caseinilytica]